MASAAWSLPVGLAPGEIELADADGIDSGLTASSDKSGNVTAIHNMFDLSCFPLLARASQMLGQRRQLQRQAQLQWLSQQRTAPLDDVDFQHDGLHPFAAVHRLRGRRQYRLANHAQRRG